MQNLNNENNIKAINKKNLILGSIFLIVAGISSFYIKCPSPLEILFIYILLAFSTNFFFISSAKKSNATIEIGVIKINLYGTIVVPFALIYINPLKEIKLSDCELQKTTLVTVTVHDKKGIQNLILRNEGKVMMDYGNRKRETSDINEKGQALFEDIPIGDSVRLNIDFSEPYESIHPDSQYVIQPNSNIYLAVVLRGIDTVQGIVSYHDIPIKRVIVKIGTLSTITDSTGYFTIHIPEQMQAKVYDVYCYKQGFIAAHALAHPQTGQILPIPIEKAKKN